MKTELSGILFYTNNSKQMGQPHLERNLQTQLIKSQNQLCTHTSDNKTYKFITTNTALSWLNLVSHSHNLAL